MEREQRSIMFAPETTREKSNEHHWRASYSEIGSPTTALVNPFEDHCSVRADGHGSEAARNVTQGV